MDLHEQIRQHLLELITIIHHLSDEQYRFSTAQNDASIGKHIRHIIEFFMLLMQQYESGTINYDVRKRDLVIENDRQTAIDQLHFLLDHFKKSDKPLVLASNELAIPTSYHRELLYQLEHIIHHNAIIRPLIERFSPGQTSANFGYAPSTVRFYGR